MANEFEIVKSEETGEVTSVKYEGKEINGDEMKRLFERDANLQKGYMEKFNALDAEKKALAEKVENAEKLEVMLSENPELEKEFEAILEKHAKKGKGGEGKEGEVSNKALEEIKKLRDELTKKEQDAQVAKAMEHYDTIINRITDELKVTSKSSKKAVHNLVYDRLVSADHKLEEKEVRDLIQECVEDFKKDLGVKEPPIKKPPQTPVPGKGGQGGAGKAEERPLPGSPGWQEFLMEKRKQHLTSE